MAETQGLPRLGYYCALLFDLDAVLTRAAHVHRAAWDPLSDEFLAQTPPAPGTDLGPFDAERDYLRYLDGRRRYDGVATFLDSRGIELPYGSPEDSPEDRTICGLGNRKNVYFHQALARHGAEIYEDAVAVVRAGRIRGVGLAVVSASESCREILHAAGLDSDFDDLVTGMDAREQALRGKPAPDTYLEAARRLDVRPSEAVVIEDAIAGVEAHGNSRRALVTILDNLDAEETERLNIPTGEPLRYAVHCGVPVSGCGSYLDPTTAKAAALDVANEGGT